MAREHFRASILGLALLSISAIADEPRPEPIRVLARVPAKTYYVGQSIELRIGAEAEGERPEVVPPVIPDTDVALIDHGFSPVVASGIGDQTAERNLFLTRFRLIPRRAGVLRIPPVRVRLGARKGASAPLQVDVRSLPPLGRPAGFLGGVGNFAVEAEASPSTLRVGQDLTYTIRVTGPAARGMSGAPDLARFSQVPLGLEIKPLPIAAQDQPPTRGFRYRIRPTRTGAASLPPLAIAAFDPTSEHYVTKVTPSIPIRVVDVPKFDPATLDYRSTPGTAASPSVPAPDQRVRGLAVLAAVIVTILALTVVARRGRRRWRSDPGRLLLKRARGLDPRQEAAETARLITDALAEYLERTIGRPRGALTPSETRSALTQVTPSARLAERSAELVAACDRARYSGRDPGPAELVAAARQLFAELGTGKRRGSRSRRGAEEQGDEGAKTAREATVTAHKV